VGKKNSKEKKPLEATDLLISGLVN
jgi:hypothetical protein